MDVMGGIVGGCAGIVIGHPLDTIKLRMQAGQFSSPTSALSQTLRNEGVRGLYKGMLSPASTHTFSAIPCFPGCG